MSEKEEERIDSSVYEAANGFNHLCSQPKNTLQVAGITQVHLALLLQSPWRRPPSGLV